MGVVPTEERMRDDHLEIVWGALLRHGFTDEGQSANDSMVLSRQYLTESKVSELLETLIRRREKLWYMFQPDEPSAKLVYEDAEAAVKALLEALDIIVSTQ
jgi:hypothetical protein